MPNLAGMVSEDQLGRKKLSNATAAANMNETTKKVRRVLDIIPSQEDLNDEEATAIVEGAAEGREGEASREETPIFVSVILN